MIPPQSRGQSVYFRLSQRPISLPEVGEHRIKRRVVIWRLRERMGEFMQHAFPDLSPENRQDGFPLSSG